MNLQFYVEKLKNSDVFKNFMKSHPDAFPCSGFFIIDKTGQDNKQHFDFYIPPLLTHPKLPAHTGSQIDHKINRENPDVNNVEENNSVNRKNLVEPILEGKMISIQLEDMQIVPIETFGHVPEEISLEHDFNFNDIEKMIGDRMARENIKKKVQKILFSFQHLDGEDLLIGTIFISMLGMIKIVINLKKMEIIEFEKKNFFDVLKINRK